LSFTLKDLILWGTIFLQLEIIRKSIDTMFTRTLRFAPIALDWFHDENVFHLPRSHIQLSKKFKRRFDHCLAACALRKSRIRNAGRGVFLLEPALSGQILLKYGGIRISFTEADRLTELVRHYDGFKFLRKITADFHMLFI